jgi:hypothetical protein
MPAVSPALILDANRAARTGSPMFLPERGIPMSQSPRSAILIVLACIVGYPLSGFTPGTTTQDADHHKRLDLMRSGGTEGSITILPVLLAGQPFDRVAEVVGVLLEQQGLKNIQIGSRALTPASGNDMPGLAASVGAFVKKNPVTTQHVLYAEYNGNRQTGLVELRAVVVDSAGQVVWTDRQGPEDSSMVKLESKDPMALSVLLAERLCPALGLTEETARNAKPGTMARRMEERSGLPPESERALLPDRQKVLKELGTNARMTVFPARIRGAVDTASAAELTAMINKAGPCVSLTSPQSPLLRSPQNDPNEMKVLWDLARSFREYCRKNRPDTDYALYADYVFNPENWEQGYVHFVVCDRSGEWVVVDLQNSHHPDYQTVKPTSTAGCSTLLVRRLQGYLR